MNEVRNLKYVCAVCGSPTDGKRVTPGSLGLELLLWLFFLLPGIIYSAWRLASRRESCGVCGASEIVPVETPRGQMLAAQFGHHGHVVVPTREGGVVAEKVVGVVILAIGLVVLLVLVLVLRFAR